GQPRAGAAVARARLGAGHLPDAVVLLHLGTVRGQSRPRPAASPVEHARGTAAVAVRAVERDLVRGLLCGAAAGHEQDRAAAGRTGPALRLPQSEHLVRVRLGGLLSRGLGTAAPSGSRTD